jgi:hypothetical protein
MSPVGHPWHPHNHNSTNPLAFLGVYTAACTYGFESNKLTFGSLIGEEIAYKQYPTLIQVKLFISLPTMLHASAALDILDTCVMV